MRRLICFFVACVVLSGLSAQGVKISPNPGAPDSSAILELADTSRGFLLPRMTTAQRNAIANPAVGLQVYNTTTQCIEAYMNAGWLPLLCNCQVFPNADFSIAPFPVTTNGASVFTAQSPGLTYQWTFQNGTPASSQSQTPSVSWQNVATVQVSLVVTDQNGCSSQKDSLITVTNCITGGSQTFSTCGQNGRTGPSQSQCNSSYGPGVVSVSGGLQNWTVPAGVCSITVEAWGAQGGNVAGGGGFHFGGLGARMRGDFAVTPGEQIQILVGQQGVHGGNSNDGAGGGGGTFVVRASNNQPLVIAGGGGGGSRVYNNTLGPPYYDHGGGGDAPVTNNGDAGGTNGTYNGGGAAGFSQTGTSNAQPFTLGGNGGSLDSGHGGFGGAANNGIHLGGGGGGYTGGNGGTLGSSNSSASNGTKATGGGSLNNGSNQSNSPGVRQGNGQVVISW